MTTTLPEHDDDFEPTPAHLGDAGALFWRDAVDGFDLSLPERAALLQAAETLDVLAALEAAIRETGPIVEGKPSPLLVEARLQRAILVRILGLLAGLVDDETEGSAGSLSPTTRAARAAARSRWRAVRAGAL